MLFIIICILTVVLVLYDIYVMILKFNNKIDKNTQDKYLYYHNLLNDLSIAEIGYLYNNGRNINTVVKATLENIKLKKYTNLTNTEKYVLDCYKFIGTKEFNQRFLTHVKDDLKNKGYIKKAKFKDSILSFSFWIVFLIGMLNIINFTRDDLQLIDGLLFLIDWVILCFSFLVLFKDEYLSKTEKGKETYLKIQALKKYIHDFGNFDDRELEEIKLWDEWILYAIILDESDNLTKDLKEEYKNIMEGINDKSV